MARLLGLGPFRNAFLIRGFVGWVGMRLAAAWVGITNPNLFQEFWIVALAATLVRLDAIRRDEDLFLGNLGIPRVAIALTALPLPILMELLVP